MGLNEIIAAAPLILLVFARIMGLIRTAPLVSSSAVPQIAKIALAFFVAFLVLPIVIDGGYEVPDTAARYIFLMVGEILIGIIMGFLLNIIYSAFLVSGQFFSLQMGFGASQVYDPLAQIQIPLMGQFLNLIGMYVFISVQGMRRIFLVGVAGSFQRVRVQDLVGGRQIIFETLLGSLGRLFEQALIISFPILGTLLLVSISMGLFAKAAPQMNLLMMGFPVAIGMAFLIILIIMPFLIDAFAHLIDQSFSDLWRLLTEVGG